LQLSIIIVNYNVKHFLEQCLCSVLNACRNIEAEIFVVDNNSTDGSRSFLETRFSTVNFIWNAENVGFAKANNQALAKAKGTYILFLNPDTIVPENCFEKCFDFFSTHAAAGTIGVRMIDGSGKFLKESKRAFPSPLTSFYKLAGLAKLFPRSKTFARYYLGHLPEKEIHEVDVLAGAFMMIPKKVIDQTGGFDEIFFMYGEDVDLSYRIQKTIDPKTGAGYKNYYFPGISIIHFKGESTRRGGLNYVRLFYKAMSLFVKKHYSGGRASVFIFFIQMGIWIRAAFSALIMLVRNIGRLFIKMDPLKESKERRTIVVANEKDFIMISTILQHTATGERVLGRVDNGDIDTDNALGKISQLPGLIKAHNIKEVIFCEEGVGFAGIIAMTQQLPSEIRNMFHASGSNSIVSSDSAYEQGETMSMHSH